jgi:hypothetical protein
MRPGCGIDCTRKEDYLSAQDFAAVRAPPRCALMGKGRTHVPAAHESCAGANATQRLQVTSILLTCNLALLLDRPSP